MSVRQVSSAALASRAWQTMFDLLIRSAPQRTVSLTRRGLTPNDSRALFSLSSRDGRTMRSLAEEWGCDPSNATWIVDHLEGLGLAERRLVPHDRRVKLVVLTAKGQRTKAELLDEFHQPPPELAALDRADLEALTSVLTKLGPEPPSHNDAVRSTRERRKIASGAKTA